MKIRIDNKLFLRTLAVLFIIEACAFLTACGDWESQAIQIIQMINPAVVALLNILAALGVSVSPSFLTAFQSWSQQAQTALTEVGNLINQYKTAEASAQPGILNEIQTALSTAASNLQQILPILHIDDTKAQQEVTAALSAVMGFLAALQNLLPAVQTATTKEAKLELFNKVNAAAKVFKTEFNNAVKNFGPQYELQ